MFTLPELSYSYNSLEPHIDEQTMRIHHDKHHAGYVNNLNKVLEGYDLLKDGIENLLKDLNSIPDDIRDVVRNNGGGHANHSLFWTIMGPDKGGVPQGSIAEVINSTFESFDLFKEQLTKTAIGRFGSGWAWLAVENNQLVIMDSANQDSPLAEGKTPIFGIDVWEHAYYLKYQNRRAEYIDAWWNLVNWDEVNRRFEEVVK
jgi:Fe-Mn family superoxide dismutase